MKKPTSLERFRAAAAQREKEAEQRRKEMEARHAAGKEDVQGAINRLAASVNREEFGGMVGGAPINNVGDGNIAGLGVGKQGEPGVDKKRKKSVVPFGMFVRKPSI